VNREGERKRTIDEVSKLKADIKTRNVTCHERTGLDQRHEHSIHSRGETGGDCWY